MFYSLFLEYPLGLGRHAVDAPVGEAVAVADGDGEAAVVGAHNLDHRVPRLARDLQRLTLAPVRRLVLCPVRVLTYKIKERVTFRLQFIERGNLGQKK